MYCWWLLSIHLSLCAATCIFDDIQPRKPVQSTVSYHLNEDTGSQSTEYVDYIDWDSSEEETSSTAIPSRQKRAGNKKSNDPYQQIRISAQYHDIATELPPVYEQKLKRIVNRAISKAMRLFSVVPVNGPLILSRSDEACQLVINNNNSSNNGKCARIHPSYFGETCLDQFKIPDDHLEGLYSYTDTSLLPKEEIAPGKGLVNTDFVLYVKSKSTSECVKGGLAIIAYAAYCQVDQYDRPVAGYINFCPLLMRRSDYDEERIYWTALHEIFHALGFSSDLFGRFKECTPQDTPQNLICSDKPNSVKSIYNAQRLVSPRVVELTSEHYNCVTHQTINEFGPILQTNSDGRVRSHWDAAFLQGSLMTPTIGLPHLTFLDPITLAFFEDTGWYKVDYRQADTYKWGKDEGCDFGLYPACLTSRVCFCEKPDQSGCHYLLLDKGKCVTDAFLHNCLIFKPEGNCTSSNVDPDILTLHGERYQAESRCFMSNITTDTAGGGELAGRCYEHRCQPGGVIQVRVGTASWQTCPKGQSIQVPGYQGLVKCPSLGQLCAETEPTAEPESEPSPTYRTSSTTTSVYPGLPIGPQDEICIELVFGTADYREVERNDQISVFRSACLLEVRRITALSEERIHNILMFDGSIHLQFDLLPPREGASAEVDEEDPSIAAVLRLLTDAVRSGNFSVVVEGQSYLATDIKEIFDIPLVSEADNNLGVIIGVTIASVVAVALIILGIFLGQRYYLFYTLRRPAATRPRQRRAGQVQQPRLHNRTSLTNHGYNGSPRESITTEQYGRAPAPLPLSVAWSSHSSGRRRHSNYHPPTTIIVTPRNAPDSASSYHHPRQQHPRGPPPRRLPRNGGDRLPPPHRTSGGHLALNYASLSDENIPQQQQQPYRGPPDYSRPISRRRFSSGLIRVSAADSVNSLNTSHTSLPQTDISASNSRAKDPSRQFHSYLPPVRALSMASLDDPTAIESPPIAHDIPPKPYKVSSSSLNSQIPIHRLSSISAPYSQRSSLSARDVHLRNDYSNRTSFSSDTSDGTFS